MADRDPWIKFRPDYWLNDLELRSCTLESRGLLIDLLCLMHGSNPYGYLVVNGVVAPESLMGKVLGIHPSKYRRCLEELLCKGVLRKDDRGRIYSKRMRSDWEKREVAREAGKRGGNPALLNPSDKGGVNLPLKPEKNKKENKNKRDKSDLNPDFLSWWQAWPEKKDKQKAAKWYGKQITNGFTPQQLLDSAHEYVEECREKGTFLKYPATFLGPDRPFEDYIEKAERRKAAEAKDHEWAERCKKATEPEPDPEMAKRMKELTKSIGKARDAE